MDLTIIGGGASGLAAAVSAAQTAKNAVNITLIEQNDRVGKKLLNTGNGRCNLSNVNIDKKFYHSGSIDVAEKIIKDSSARVADFFKSIGLLFMEENGRLYPYSQRAGSVLDVLRMAADALGVKIITEVKVDFDDFNALLNTSKVIIATGGFAAPSTGSKGDGLWFMSEIGHKIEDTFPALTGLLVKHPAFPFIKGIRIRPCGLTLNGVYDEGEVLFTEDGISGIPAMNLSGAWKEPTDIRIDLLPHMTEEEVSAMIDERKNILHLTPEDFYTGLFHKNLGRTLIRDNANLKNWTLRVTGVRNYKHAQVTGGGISLEKFNPENMQSLLNKKLFAAGEVLDVYGDCGGYNLHWAWITGILAGRGAVRAIEKGI